MKTLSLILLCWLLSSCAPPGVIMRPEGTMATIHEKDGKDVEGELLAVHGGSILVLADSLQTIPRSQILSVGLLIDEGRGWVLPVLLLQAAPSLVALASASVDARLIAAGGLCLAGATWLCFELSTPRTMYREPMTESDLDELSVHLRFPYGLSESQLSELREAVHRSPKRNPDWHP